MFGHSRSKHPVFRTPSPRRYVPWTALPLTLLATLTLQGQVVINEIHYHPASEDVREEYIELFNTGTSGVSLNGWRFSDGIDFTFTNASIPAGGFLVVVADLATFTNAHPGVTNVAGNWTGVLNNIGETVRLDDNLASKVDEVFYADEGDYAIRVRGVPDYLHRGWDWLAEHDGLGKSLERINPALTGKCGQNWISSTPTNGTPGVENSMASTNIAPLIREVAHYPLVPRSTDPVTITARLTDEQTNGFSATLYWRDASTTTPPTFTAAAMFDDGAHGDGLAGDGLFGAVLGANADGTVIEFYISAVDAQATSRTWPATARETNGTPTQVCNALYQVDDSTTDTTRPSYRLVMTKLEYDELYAIPNEGSPNNRSHAQFNGTFVTFDGTSAESRYNCAFRNRGESSRSAQPPNYRVRIPSDRRWKGLLALNLNSQYTHCQVAGAAVAGSAGLPTEQHRRVQLRVNGNDRANAGSRQFGSYVFQEAINSDFAREHWPADAGGNLYRGGWSIARGGHHATLDYVGTNYLTYITDGYSKNSNRSENDWTDLFQLTDVLSNTSGSNYWAELQQVVNVDEWVRYFAVFSLIGSEETSLGTGSGDDYTLYRGLADTRFNLVAHDWDTILNQGDSAGNPSASIFRATAVTTVNRFLKHPEVAPSYYAELLHQLNTTFAPSRMSAILDQSLGDWIPLGNITLMKTFATNRHAGVLAQIPLTLSAQSSLPVSSGYPRTNSATTTLTGSANAIETRAILVNGVPATYVPWQGSWSASGVVLTPGINRVVVQSLNTNAVEFARTTIDVWYDDGSVATVGGTIGSDTTWTAAGGPYNVTGNIIVPNGVTLTIEPGTTLYLGSSVTVTVNDGGRLLAEGTETAPIRFTTTPGSATTWGGLTVNGSVGSPETRIAHTHFEGNNSTCIQVTAGTVFLDHLTFGTTTRQYLSLDGVSFVVQDCVFPTATAAFELVHGTQGIKSGGRGVFQRNFFGAANGYNDVVDFTGGNRPGPVVHFFDNVFIGSGDDVLDLDGADGWIEGNIFMHVHKNGPPDSASGVSGGGNGGNTSELTLIGNLFYDCDHAAMAKQGNFFTLFNNTIVHQTHAGGLDTEGAVVCLKDDATAEGAGMYLEGNIISDAEELVRGQTASIVTFTNNLIHQLAGTMWAGPGGNNSTNNPLLAHVPQLSETTSFSTWAAAQVMWDWFKPRTGSPAIGSGPNGWDKGGVIPHGASISGEPPVLKSSTSATLNVGFARTGSGIPVAGFPNGSGFTHYTWRLDGGGWSAETPVGTSISLTGLANGTHHVEVNGKLDTGLYQDAAEFAPDNAVTGSREWTVNTALSGLRLNEVLARNIATLVTNSESPDLVELFNAGPATVDLSGMGVTDNAANKYRFIFAPGTTLGPGEFLVLFSDSNANPARNLGFGFNSNGGELSLFASAANGGVQLDTVSFGPQLVDLSVGRLDAGSWGLCQPTFGTANRAQPATDGSALKINEWLASGAPTAPDDFIELFNPDPMPAAMGGLHLSDEPSGYPRMHLIESLSFIAPGAWFAFKADGNTPSGPEHLNFRLSAEQGRIGLFGSNLALIDFVYYGPQITGVSQGRSPDGAETLTFFTTPTPGAGNPGALPPYVTNITFNLMAYTNIWRFNQSNNLDGVSWMATNYNDSAWQSGAGLLAGGENNANIVPLVNTTLLAPSAPPPGLSSGHAYYFRTTLVVTNDLTGYTLDARMRLDDCAAIYVNGVEISRTRLPAGPILNLNLGGGAIGSGTDADVDESLTLPASALHPGTNLIAVEVHQTTVGSSDIVWGMAIDATRYITNFTTVVLNEVFADNGSYTNADGTLTDWVELYNPSATPFNLTGYSLSDDPGSPGRWMFPSGVAVAPAGFLLVRCDSATAASGTNGPVLNTGFGLNSAGDKACLFTPGDALLDAIAFGPQAADFSIGHRPDGSGGWGLTLPTPGSANIAASLGDAAGVRINEWAASVSGGPDWFELYNPNPQPVAVGGLYLSDNLANRTKHLIAPLSFLGVNTNGWRKFVADGDTAKGANHVDFSLGAGGEVIGLFPLGTGPAVDTVVFGAQTTDVSEGRFADGSTNRVFFTKPSPGEANWLYLTNIVINEVLSHSDLPLEDALEIRNLTAAPVDVSGWFISDAFTDLRKFRIPNGTIIPANGFKVFYEYELNPQPGFAGSFSFSSARGDDVWLTAADGLGAPTGYRDYAKFGPLFNGYSFGRFVTSVGVEFPAMTALTFGTGVTAQSPTNQITVFRTGAGAANTYPRIGPVVISEIQYHPAPLGTNDNARDEFIELLNITGGTVPLYDTLHPTNGWKLLDAVDFVFNTNHSLSAGEFMLVVSFDPATNATALAAFRAAHGTNGLIIGPWSGKLNNGGESVELVAPDNPQTLGPDIGLVPYAMMDRVVYSDLAPWPTNADGFGPSLQRVSVTSYGNDPLNWIAATPNAGSSGLLDSDGDGMPDAWEDANGLNKLINDAGLDADTDGFTNLQEYIAGTNPRSAASRFKIDDVVWLPGGMQISFLAASNKTYSVLYRDTLGTGDWTKLTDMSAQPVTQNVSVNDNSASGITTRFYRLVTPSTP